MNNLIVHGGFDGSQCRSDWFILDLGAFNKKINDTDTPNQRV